MCADLSAGTDLLIYKHKVDESHSTFIGHVMIGMKLQFTNFHLVKNGMGPKLLVSKYDSTYIFLIAFIINQGQSWDEPVRLQGHSDQVHLNLDAPCI